uniref:integrin alpha-7-like n=1 Tax=Myxine glutinosa TaxID=7769 RepID=UPI00358F4DC1
MLPVMFVGALVILLGELPEFYSFNLDVDHSPVKTGPKNSFFGLSVTGQRLLHQEVRSSRLLVGAPLSTRDGGPLNATGDLYRCPLTMKSDDCQRVPIDDNLNPQESQWLGVSVDSQGLGGLVVTCAHRWEKRRNVGEYNMEQHNQLGRCFLMNQDLKMPESNYFTRPSTVCEGRGSGHAEYGMCQQGITAGFVRGTDLLYYGAPGALTWTGMVWVRRIHQDHGNIEDEKETDVRKKVNVTFNSYMGFSVTGSYGLTQKNQYTMVAGIPRVNHTGAVVLLEPDVKYLVEKILLVGFQIASGFGYSLAVADFNADTWMDLVVGAPNYLDKSGEVGGAVYVFINNGGSFAQMKYVRLSGKTNSMFGLAVARLGDQDLDGFEADPQAPDVSAQLQHWLSLLTSYLGAQEGLTDATRLAVLNSRVSHIVYTYISQCATYAAAEEELRRIYIKTLSVVYTRYLHASRRQDPSEAIDHFVQELR